MFLGLFHIHSHPDPAPYLYARTRLLDGSEILIHLVALREYLWANRFEVFSEDGNKVIGVPKSPRVLRLHQDEHLPERGQIKLCDIDWLIVKGRCH
jgi:hypothetical protein